MPSATSAGAIVFDIIADSKPFQRSLNSLQGVAGVIGKRVAAAFSVTALTAFSKACFDAASSAQQTANRIATVFPSMSDQINSFASTAMEKMGMGAGSAKKLMAQFGMMAQGMGYSEEASANMSASLTKLAGDMAAFYGISTEEAQSKLTGVFTGMTRGLKTLGVNMSEANLQAHALSLGISKDVSTMSDAELAALRLSYAQAQLAKTNGYAYKNLGTWAGQTALLQQQWAKLKATLGKAFIAALLPVLKIINMVLSGIISLANAVIAVIEKVTGKKLDQMLGGAQSAAVDLGDATEDASDSTANLAKSQNTAAKSAKKAEKAQKALTKALASFDKINKLASKQKKEKTTSADGDGDAAKTTGLGISKQIAAASGLSDTLKKVNSEGSKLKKIKLPPALQKAIERLGPPFERLVRIISNGLKWAWKNIVKPFGKWFLKNVAPELVDAFGTLIDILGSVLEIVGTVFGPIWKHLIKPILKLVGKVLVWTLQDLNRKLKVVAAVLKAVAKFLKGAFKKAAEKAKEAVEAFKKAWEALKSRAIELGVKLGEKWDELKEWVGEKVEAAGEFVKEIGAALSDAWGNLKKWMGEKLSAAGEAVKNVGMTLAGAWDTLKTAIQNKLAAAGSFVKEVGRALSSTWDNLKTAIQNKIKAAGAFAASLGVKIAAKAKALRDKVNSIVGKVKAKAIAVGMKLKATLADAKALANGVIAKINAELHKLVWPSLQVGNVKVGGGQIFPGKAANWPIPQLAQGGYIARNTPRLAVIGDNRREGEIVAPESKLQAMADQAAGADMTTVEALLRQLIDAVQKQDLSVSLDGRQIARSTVGYINTQTRATGRSPLMA